MHKQDKLLNLPTNYHIICGNERTKNYKYYLQTGQKRRDHHIGDPLVSCRFQAFHMLDFNRTGGKILVLPNSEVNSLVFS